MQLIVEIPTEVITAGLLQSAAKTVGWTEDANLDEAANIQRAIVMCFEKLTIPAIMSRAIEQRATERTLAIRQEEQTAMTTAAEAWLAANQAA